MRASLQELQTSLPCLCFFNLFGQGWSERDTCWSMENPWTIPSLCKLCRYLAWIAVSLVKNACWCLRSLPTLKEKLAILLLAPRLRDKKMEILILSPIQMNYPISRKRVFEGALDKYNIIPKLFQKKVGIFIPSEVLAWVVTACCVLHSRLTYFWKNMNISSIFYFSKSTSTNTQCRSQWDTLKMMLFTKYPVKGKRIVRINWKFRSWFNLESSIELDIKR